MFSSLSRNTTQLIQQEIALAKAEATQSAKRAGVGAGMLAGAAIAALFFLLFLSNALWMALGHLIGLGWSALVVGVIWAIIATVLGLLGKSKLQQVKGIPKTVDTAKDIPPTMNPAKETP
nr:phage holin family protein [Brevibacterium ihuae]